MKSSYKFSKLFLPALLCLLASCAGKKAVDPVKYLNRAPVSYESYEQFSFQPMQVGEAFTFKLNTDSDIFVFEKEAVYFQAFELPVITNHILSVKSWFNGHSVGSYAHPAFVFLDNEHQVIESFYTSMDFKQSLLIGDFFSYMTTRLEIPVTARFLVIYPSGPKEKTVIPVPRLYEDVMEGQSDIEHYKQEAYLDVDPVEYGKIQLKISPLESRPTYKKFPIEILVN